MKATVYSEKKFRKMALFFARILDYDKVVRLKDWQGCPVFEPRYKDDTVRNDGCPMMIIIRNGATCSLTEEETGKYLCEEYPELTMIA